MSTSCVLSRTVCHFLSGQKKEIFNSEHKGTGAETTTMATLPGVHYRCQV